MQIKETIITKYNAIYAYLLAHKQLLYAGVGLIILLIVLTTAGLIALLQKPSSEDQMTDQRNVPNSSSGLLSPAIAILPSEISLTPGQREYSAEIIVDSSDITADGVMLEIDFDSSVITDVRLTRSSDADVTIGGAVITTDSTRDTISGKEFLTIKRNPSQNLASQKMNGRVGMLYFTLVEGATLPTTITLTPASDFITTDNSLKRIPQLTSLTITGNSATISSDAQERLLRQQQSAQ